MCVIVVADKKRPTLEIVNKCHAKNSDGGGIAWFNKKGKAEYRKGLNVQEIYDLTQSVPLPFVAHFRLASCGGKNELLTHPFEITKKSELKLAGQADKLLIHNGTFADWKICLAAANVDEPDVNSPLSDTRAIAMILARHRNYNFLDKISGRFIVMDATTKQFHFFGDFDEEGGIWYSNLFWKNYYKNYTNCNVTYYNQASNPNNYAPDSNMRKYSQGNLIQDTSIDKALSKLKQDEKDEFNRVVTQDINESEIADDIPDEEIPSELPSQDELKALTRRQRRVLYKAMVEKRRQAFLRKIADIQTPKQTIPVTQTTKNNFNEEMSIADYL